MGNPHLTDPRKKFHTEKFPDQEQNTPALQNKMSPNLTAEKNHIKDTIAWKDAMP